MNIAVFGATGGTGLQITEQALEAGHSVTALVRDAGKMTIQHPNLHVIVGDVLDATKVNQVVAGADAVACSLGTTGGAGNAVSQGTRNIIAAMNTHGVKRLVVVSALGAGDSRTQVPFVFKVIMTTVLKKAYEEKDLQEAAVQASNLEWVIVRPGGLTDGPRSGGNYSVGELSKDNRVSRADVAEFVLLQLTSPHAMVGQAVAIT